ncbi:MAG: prepilin-type N-terminal cleavage/methylation domain-containing protein [Pseudomonadota bacterium]
MKVTKVIQNQNGFTLIELMVVAVILAIISAIAVPIYNGYKKEAAAQEAYTVLAQVMDLCSGKILKVKETGAAATTFTLETPAAGKYFTYGAPTCATAGVGAAATGSGSITATGAVSPLGAGDTLILGLTVTAAGAGTKTFSGTLL